MAARTGSGILTALIVFAIAAVLAIAGCVWLFLELDAEKGRSAGAERTASDLRQSLSDKQTAMSALASLAVGDENATAETARTTLGLKETETASAALDAARRERTAAESTATELNSQLKDYESQVQSLQRAAEAADAERDRAIDEVRTATTKSVQTESAMAAERAELLAQYSTNIQELRGEALAREAELQGQVDELTAARVRLAGEVEELRNTAQRAQPQDASELVDGEVVAIDQSHKQAYISLGSKDRVRPTMTFEVFDSPGDIRVDGNGHQIPGKASVEVIRVGEHQSLVRVHPHSSSKLGTASVGKGDVIANAAYSRDYRYRFLIHGIFDTDDDGVPSSAERDVIAQRVGEWGGTVVDTPADEQVRVSGDIDFLVVGQHPPLPPPLPMNASPEQYGEYERARAARETYDRLVEEAKEAQIPVLNWNRFQVLTGSTPR